MCSQSFVPHFRTRDHEFYFVVDCPVTQKPLPFERDPSRGRIPYPAERLILPCAYCDAMQRIAFPKVLSVLVSK